MGRDPMFSVGALDFGVPHALPFYLVLGVLCGIAALAFSRSLYWIEDQFEKLPVPQMWWPAIGALGLGIIGYFVPRVLGVGYDTISDILNTRMVLGALLAVMIFKSAALVISLGSGTSGGLLAPMFMASAAMGSAFAMIVDSLASRRVISRSLRAGGDGRCLWRCVASCLHLYHLRLRNHA